MHFVTTLLVCLVFLLGFSELALAGKKGIPGRRVGGGTRWEEPRHPRVPID